MASELCAHCTRQTNTDVERASTSACQQAEAEKMLKASRIRYEEVNIGKNVRIYPSREDRGKGDPRSLIGVVLDKVDGFYKLGTRAGEFWEPHLVCLFACC